MRSRTASVTSTGEISRLRSCGARAAMVLRARAGSLMVAALRRRSRRQIHRRGTEQPGLDVPELAQLATGPTDQTGELGELLVGDRQLGHVDHRPQRVLR